MSTMMATRMSNKEDGEEEGGGGQRSVDIFFLFLLGDNKAEDGIEITPTRN